MRGFPLHNVLFRSFALGDLTLPNRILMAPLTRARAGQPGDVPTVLNARYYASPTARGFALTPGLYTEEQAAGWRLVIDAVHAAGGRIVLQLWHVGRASHARLLDGAAPLSPSGIPGNCRVWIIGEDGNGRMVEASPPRAMTSADITSAIADTGVLRGASRLSEVLTFMRPAFAGSLVINGGLSDATASELIGRGLADLAAFGRAFLANPDLPTRLRRGAALNDPDPTTFYGGRDVGYTDYLPLEPATA